MKNVYILTRESWSPGEVRYSEVLQVCSTPVAALQWIERTRLPTLAKSMYPYPADDPTKSTLDAICISRCMNESRSEGIEYYITKHELLEERVPRER